MKWFTCLLACLIYVSAACSSSIHAAETDTQKLSKDRRISINFSNVDITVFIDFYSELTGRNFIIDPRVKGNVTILSSQRISMSELEAVFQSTLEVNGFSAVDAGQVTKIVPANDAPTMAIITETSLKKESTADFPITQIIPLTHADAIELKRLLTPMLSRRAVIGAHAETNVLLITDSASNVRRILKIIKELESGDRSRELTLVPLSHSDGHELATILKSVFQARSSGKKAQGQSAFSVVVDDRTNMLVLLAKKADTQRIKKLIEVLDQRDMRERGKIRVYYIKNADVEELAKTLGELPTEGAAPNTGKGKAPVVPASLKISSDPATNSLIVSAEEEEDFHVLEGIIEALDIPREMVYIEALIMEVDAQEDLRFGVEWTAVGETQIGNKDAAVAGGFVNQSGQSALQALPSGLVPPGFALGVFTEAIDIAGVQFSNLTALIQAFKSNQSINIVSTPQLLTTDNEEAKIVVATNLPFQSGTSTFQDDTFDTFEYRDVGTTMGITPQIGPEDTLRLTISLELSLLESTIDFKPTTLKRTIDTDVLIQNANTIVIGGLIEDSQALTEFKVPLLGDIPLLGWLFKFQGESQQKTNLFIFLTPHVVKRPTEAAALHKQKRETIENIKKEQIAK
jgi:general secretion pathway protein D